MGKQFKSKKRLAKPLMCQIPKRAEKKASREKNPLTQTISNNSIVGNLLDRHGATVKKIVLN